MKVGRILLILIIAGLLWGLLARHVRRQFDDRRVEIIHQCEAAVPVFSQRYQHLQALLEVCEKQDGWVMPRVLNEPPSTDFQAAPADPADSLTRPDSENPGSAWDVHEAMDHFTKGQTPFEKVMGALSIEECLEQLTAAADNIEAVKQSDVLARFKADLKATAPAASTNVNQLEAAIVGYDQSSSRNFIAKLLQIQPIERDSIVTPPIEDD